MPLDDLLRRVRDREPQSLHTLMVEHGPHVYSVALRITGSETDAEALVRDLFLDLPDTLDGFEGDDFRAWLRTLATRRAYRLVRSADRSAVPARHDLESAIAGLEDDQRAVFVLKEVEGLPHEEVARTLGITAGLSRVRLHRARKALIEHFRAVNLGLKHPTRFMLSRFVDHDVPPEIYGPIDEHLDVCTSCRHYVAWLRDLQYMARTLRPPRPMPPRIADDVIRRRGRSRSERNETS